MKRNLSIIATGLILPTLVVLVWDWLVRTGRWSPSLIARPLDVYHKLIILAKEGVLWENTTTSLFRLFAGFLLGSLVGIAMGIWVGLSKTVSRLVEPLFLVLIPVPPLAWIPLLIIIFGIDQGVKIALLSIGSFCTLFLTASFSARTTDKSLLELSALYNKPWYTSISRIILPSSTAALIGSLRVAMALSWTLLMASEMIASSAGLGWFIWDSRNFSRPDDMIAGMITVGVFGWLTDFLLRLLGRYLHRWKRTDDSSSLPTWLRHRWQPAPVLLANPAILASSHSSQFAQTSHSSKPGSHRLDISIHNKEFPLNGHKIPVLQNIDLQVQPGEFICIIGPSGSGKSTLLKILAGLDTEYTGQVLHDGEPVTGASVKRGIVFQEQRLLPWLKIDANVGFGLPHTFSAIQKQALINDTLQLVGLAAYTDAYPAELSGGMQQRVALARSLVNLPDLLLLDEPFGALDSITRDTMQKELLHILQQRQTTVVMVTHDIDEAIVMSNRILVLGGTPATIKKCIPLDKKSTRHKTSAAFTEIRNHLISHLYETSL